MLAGSYDTHFRQKYQDNFRAFNTIVVTTDATFFVSDFAMFISMAVEFINPGYCDKKSNKNEME